jgi:prephenate dehydrogenase
MRIPNTPIHPTFTRAGIFGLGLIGGSWARALKNLGAHILAMDVHSPNIEAALNAGAIDEAASTLENFNGFDLLILCAPPGVVCDVLPRFAQLNIGLVTDVCSVKGPVMEAARDLKNFIGGHPMAGSEQTGFAASNARLFENAPYALCVASGHHLPHERIAAFESLLARIGARAIHMTAAEHDASVASVSHLPHAAAFALRRVAMEQPECLKLKGRGYADMTRIANSPPALWADILLRSPEILPALSRYIAVLSELSGALARRDAAAVKECLKK